MSIDRHILARKKLRETILSLFETWYAPLGYSVDKLMQNPSLSLEFCHNVRYLVKDRTWSEERILGMLTSERKQGNPRTHLPKEVKDAQSSSPATSNSKDQGTKQRQTNPQV